MPSIRARLINRLLRLTVKRRWRPGLQIEEVRANAAKMDGRLARRPADCAVEAVTVGGVPAHWFGEAELATRNGTLLYLHGGAWCLHLPALYAAFAAMLCRTTGMRVLLPDYRLAPEQPYPAAVEDCLAVYRALAEGPGGPPCAIAGDSAGGSLSLVTLDARSRRGPRPAGVRCAAVAFDRPHDERAVDAVQRSGRPDVQRRRRGPAAGHVLSGQRAQSPVACRPCSEHGTTCRRFISWPGPPRCCSTTRCAHAIAHARPGSMRGSTSGSACRTCSRCSASCQSPATRWNASARSSVSSPPARARRRLSTRGSRTLPTPRSYTATP